HRGRGSPVQDVSRLREGRRRQRAAGARSVGAGPADRERQWDEYRHPRREAGQHPGADAHDDQLEERTGPHLFTVTSGPLTSRFFTVTLGGATLADPPDVEV